MQAKNALPSLPFAANLLKKKEWGFSSVSSFSLPLLFFPSSSSLPCCTLCGRNAPQYECGQERRTRTEAGKERNSPTTVAQHLPRFVCTVKVDNCNILIEFPSDSCLVDFHTVLGPFLVQQSPPPRLLALRAVPLPKRKRRGRPHKSRTRKGRGTHNITQGALGHMTVG